MLMTAVSGNCMKIEIGSNSKGTKVVTQDNEEKLWSTGMFSVNLYIKRIT